MVIGKPYKHTTPLYINYKEKHFTNSKDYEILKVAKLVDSTSVEDSMGE